MDDCDGPNIFVASKEKKIAEKVNCEVLTDRREYRHQGVTTLFLLLLNC